MRRAKPRFPYSLALVAAGFSCAAAFSQQPSSQPAPSPDAQIIRVRIGSSAGMCQGYCSSQTTVDPQWFRNVSKSLSDKKHYPEMKSEWRIAKSDWEDLLRFLDDKVLAAFVGRIGCPGCADQVVEFAEIEYSDGTKKSVSFNRGNGPPEIAALVAKIRSIGAKTPPPSKGKSASGSPLP